MMTDKDLSAAGSKPITPFIRTRPAESKIQATLLGLNNTFPFVEKIIKEYTGQIPIHIQEACFKHTKKCFEDRVIPFLDIFKIHVMHCESLYAMNKRNIPKNKCLQIQKKNLLIHDESLIVDCIAKDVCSIVLASEREVLPRSNCRYEELQSTCDREHSRKQFVDLQVKFQNYKECLPNQKICEQPNATASNAIFEINKLKAQLQEKDDTIRHLHAEKDILGLLNVGSIESSFETKALETEIAQLKEGLTSLKIQNDGYKVTNTKLNKCYQELSKANTHLRTTSYVNIVPPISDCMCAELRTSYDREHNRVLELEAEISKLHNMLKEYEKRCVFIQKDHIDLQVKFQNYKECLRNQKVCEQPNATASNAIFEINKLKAQLQKKDDTIRHLHAEKDVLCLLNVGSTESSFETKALETDIAQLKEGLTSLKIQNDGYKVTNANLNKCYQELSKANTHLRTTSLEKIATQKAEIATMKAEAVGKKNSGPTGTPTKPKVLASGMYTKRSKTLPRSTQKPPVQHKKPTVSMNMFPKAKPATEARKPIPKRNTQNHNPLPAKSVKARRAADYYKNLYVDISQFVDRSTKSMHAKPHQAKRVVHTSTNA
nr:hypothetical protein [Tanacetum cinerariifolium]